MVMHTPKASINQYAGKLNDYNKWNFFRFFKNSQVSEKSSFECLSIMLLFVYFKSALKINPKNSNILQIKKTPTLPTNIYNDTN